MAVIKTVRGRELWKGEFGARIRLQQVTPLLDYIVEEGADGTRSIYVVCTHGVESGIFRWFFVRNFPMFLSASENFEERVGNTKGPVVFLGYVLKGNILGVKVLTQEEYQEMLNELIEEDEEEE